MKMICSLTAIWQNWLVTSTVPYTRTTETVDFSKYETDAHNYGGSDSKKSIYFNGKYYMIKMPNEIQTDNSLQTSISNKAQKAKTSRI